MNGRMQWIWSGAKNDSPKRSSICQTMLRVWLIQEWRQGFRRPWAIWAWWSLTARMLESAQLGPTYPQQARGELIMPFPSGWLKSRKYTAWKKTMNETCGLHPRSRIGSVIHHALVLFFKSRIVTGPASMWELCPNGLAKRACGGLRRGRYPTAWRVQHKINPKESVQDCNL